MEKATQYSGSYALDDITLIIVHANCMNDENWVSKDPIQGIIDSGIASRIYEHRKNRCSFVHHNGIIFDYEDDPGNYDRAAYEGSRFVVVGGGIERCMYGAVESLVEQLKRCRGHYDLHLPADCIYDAEIGESCGDSVLDSYVAGMSHERFSMYEELVKNANMASRMIFDASSSDSRRVLLPGLDFTLGLYVWGSKDDMAGFLREQYMEAA